MDETIRSEAGESRWPMAGAVAAVIVLTYLLPAQVRVVSFGDVRVAPILEAVLLAALIIGDPGRIDRRTTALHRLATALVLVMLGGALVQTVALTVDLIKGGGVTDSGSPSGGRLHRLGRQQHLVRAALLAAGRRRGAGPRAPRGPASGLRVSSATRT